MYAPYEISKKYTEKSLRGVRGGDDNRKEKKREGWKEMLIEIRRGKYKRESTKKMKYKMTELKSDREQKKYRTIKRYIDLEKNWINEIIDKEIFKENKLYTVRT